MALDPRSIQLTDAQRKLLAAKANETGRSASELLEEMLGPLQQPQRQLHSDRSLLDALKERGMVGAMKGPGDLSTNPVHMKGFGESRDPANID